MDLFDNQGVQWVRFWIRSNDGRSQMLEAEFIRFIKIKRKKADPVQRPLVYLDLCLAGRRNTVPVSLSDRANFKYRMLIGRSVLRSGFLVDSAQTYTSKALCEDK